MSIQKPRTRTQAVLQFIVPYLIVLAFIAIGVLAANATLGHDSYSGHGTGGSFGCEGVCK